MIRREWAKAIVHGHTDVSCSRRFSTGMIALRPEGDGRITGYEGLELLDGRGVAQRCEPVQDAGVVRDLDGIGTRQRRFEQRHRTLHEGVALARLAAAHGGGELLSRPGIAVRFRNRDPRPDTGLAIDGLRALVPSAHWTNLVRVRR